MLRRLEVLFPLALLAVVLVIRSLDPAPLKLLRLQFFDFYQTLSPREYTPAPVRIVDIDEPSLAAVGQWPWPRDIIADMTQGLQRGLPGWPGRH